MKVLLILIIFLALMLEGNVLSNHPLPGENNQPANLKDSEFQNKVDKFYGLLKKKDEKQKKWEKDERKLIFESLQKYYIPLG